MTTLTDAQIKAAKPREKLYKLPKENGLTVAIYPNGIKGFRHYLTINGRETTLSYGNYPDLSLKDAREKRDETRRQLVKGINPVAQRRAEKMSRADTFEAIAREWLAAGCPPNKNDKPTDPDTVAQLTRRLEKYAFPYHGSTPIKDVSTSEFHSTLKRIIARGKHETAHRVRSVASRVFRFAVATGRAERDPAADLKDALPTVSTTSFAAIVNPKEIGELLRAIDGYQGQPAVMAALKLAPLVFVRPVELRGAEWAEIDLKKGEWLIPETRMKMGRDHWVPLAKQAVTILEEQQKHSGRGKLVFPGIRSKSRLLSENTLNAALRRLDYTSDQMVAHGFRSMASTRLNELGFDADVIEAQLAHVDRNRVRSIYNRAEYAEKRRGMMQSWADYLDGLKADTGAKVVAIRG